MPYYPPHNVSFSRLYVSHQRSIAPWRFPSVRCGLPAEVQVLEHWVKTDHGHMAEGRFFDAWDEGCGGMMRDARSRVDGMVEE